MKYATVAALLLMIITGMPARAAISTLSEADKTCLGCHGTAGIEKQRANGETRSLHVAPGEFAQSVHSVIGCGGCHADINLSTHFVAKDKIAGSHEKSFAHIKICRVCHEEKFNLYEGSIHASLRRQGVPVAPVCTDCHSPHRVIRKAAYDSTTGTPCSKCHGSIFQAYAGSVHGQIRTGKDGAHAPGCAGCHRAHDVTAAATENQLKNTCLGCHQDVLLVHQKWLPNAGRHFESVSCPACHAPAAQRKVDLRLYDSATQKRLRDKEGVPQFENRARAVDVEGKGLNALALRSLLREFNRDGGDGKTILRGRLEVRTGVEAHQLADKTQAIRDCEQCHRKGSDPFQSVTISIARPDGRLLRYDAQNEVLSSTVSIESVGGFYAIGATRIKLLDTLLLFAVVGGITVPIGHMTTKWLVRKYLKRGGGHPRDQAPSSPDDRSTPE